jgi:two-component system cell cycle sensor histidine kinase/response regulator CckA
MKKPDFQTTGDLRKLGRGIQGLGTGHIERREWWLWSTAIAITLLLTFGIASFLPVLLHTHYDWEATFTMRQAVWGLLGLVLLFDLYTLYQQLQIHRIRRQLEAKEKLFRLITENAADMIALVDTDGRRIYNSLSYQRVLGYSPSELQRSSSFEQIHPDDRERVMTAGKETRLTGEGKPLEYRIRHKDGSWRVLESTSSLIRAGKGDPDMLVVVNRDITVRKHAEEALRVSEASFRSVVEGAPYGILRASVSGQLLQVNSALREMLGYRSSTELLNATLGEHVFRSPVDFEHLFHLLGSVDEFKDTEMEWKRKDGSPLTVRCSGRKMKSGHEDSTYYEVFVEDITERRILERQLRMAAKMEAVGRLSGGIAHDFNNLLGVIIGYSQMLKRKIDRNNPFHEYIEEIEKAGQRATSLTRQLLAFSRQQILTPIVLDLNELVSDMAKMLPRLIGEDIAVRTKLGSAIGKVKADQGQVEQVVMNLAVNARDAMPNGGRLTIETADVVLDEIYARQHAGSKPGKYVMLSVADSGIGMNSETLLHIFEPFFTTKEIGKGTGLGLATVYGVVKQSGGYIWVDSEPGKGSCFQIFLPRVEEGVTQVTEERSSSRVFQGNETILVAEDAEALRKLGRTFLEERGFRVLTASSGEEALEVARKFSGKIHLLLTDVVMPGMNGRVLAEHMLKKRPEMRVLYMSGYTDSFIAGHGVLEAGTHLLHKPFTQEVLVSKVCEVLKSAPAIAEKKAMPAAELPLQKV